MRLSTEPGASLLGQSQLLTVVAVWQQAERWTFVRPALSFQTKNETMPCGAAEASDLGVGSEAKNVVNSW